jgi:hypothetical protein
MMATCSVASMDGGRYKSINREPQRLGKRSRGIEMEANMARSLPLVACRLVDTYAPFSSLHDMAGLIREVRPGRPDSAAEGSDDPTGARRNLPLPNGDTCL